MFGVFEYFIRALKLVAMYEDAPNIFRRGSVISQIALQFKKYGFKELEVMADMLGKSTDYKQKLTFWGMYFLACGLLQVPRSTG